MINIPKQLKIYEDYLRIQNFSPRTVKSYTLWLRHFLEFRQTQKLAGPLDQEQARLYMLFSI